MSFFTRTIRYVRVFNWIANPSVVCNVRVPYSGGWNFLQYFFAVLYLGHHLIFVQNFTKIIPGKPVRRGRQTQEGYSYLGMSCSDMSAVADLVLSWVRVKTRLQTVHFRQISMGRHRTHTGGMTTSRTHMQHKIPAYWDFHVLRTPRKFMKFWEKCLIYSQRTMRILPHWNLNVRKLIICPVHMRKKFTRWQIYTNTAWLGVWQLSTKPELSSNEYARGH